MPCAAFRSRSRRATRDEPEAALVTLTASGVLDEGISCSVTSGRAIAAAGLHPASGGDGALLCSGDMLLEALVACVGVTLRAVATALEIPVRGGTVTAAGELDFRGTLAVDRAAAVGFREIRLRFELDADADADAERLQTLLALVDATRPSDSRATDWDRDHRKRMPTRRPTDPHLTVDKRRSITPTWAVRANTNIQSVALCSVMTRPFTGGFQTESH